MNLRKWTVVLLVALLLGACGAREPLVRWEDGKGGALVLLESGELRLTPGEGRWVLTGVPPLGGETVVLELELEGDALRVRYQNGRQTLQLPASSGGSSHLPQR